MRKLFTLSLLCFQISLLIGQTTMVDPNEIVHHESASCINLDHPRSWHWRSEVLDADIYLVRPMSKMNDALREHITVRKERLLGADPQKAFESYMFETKNKLAATIINFELEGVRVIKLDNYQAYEYTYTGLYEATLDAKWKSYYIFYGGWVYTVSYLGDYIQFDEYEEQASNIMRSIRIDL